MNPLLRRLVPLAVIPLLACGKSNPTADGTFKQSSRPRAAAGSVAAADVSTQAHDNAGFAFDLYAQLRGTPGNIFISPYSISSALAMVSAGARGESLTAMNGTLHFELPAPRVHAAFNALDDALAQRARVGTSAQGGPFQLRVANAVWAQDGLGLQPDFLDVLAENYGAGVHLVDFLRQPTAARGTINGWVSQATDGKIPELLQAGDVDASTRLVLTNAIAFSGAWATPFDPALTHSGAFHALDGQTVQVPLMHQSEELRFARAADFSLVELPYSNRDLSLVVLVPDANQFAAVESRLSADFLDAALGTLHSSAVTLDLPRFGMTTQARLRQPLSTLGMGPAFGDGADFSGIDGLRDLHIADVIHQATVRVDEAGTEAAAATAVVLAGTAVLPPVNLSIDRPFLVILRDAPTGSVLFVGRVVSL
jgi:serpin B